MASKELGVMTSQVKEEINALIASGLQVLNVPEDCLCSNCGMLAVFHFTNGCSHLYCRSCYFAFKLENRICRKCRTPIGGKPVENDSIDLVIANLKTECANKNLGCNDVITLRDLLEHTENCMFSKMRLGTKEYSNVTTTDLENIFDSKLQKMANEFSFKLERTNIICANIERKLETVEAKLLNIQVDFCGENVKCHCRCDQLEKRVADLEKNLASRSSGQLKETCDKVDAVLKNIGTMDAVFLQRTDSVSNELNKCRETIDQLHNSLDETKTLVAQLNDEKIVITEDLTDVGRTLATVREKIDSPADFISKKEFKRFQQMQAQHMNCTMERLRGPHNGTFIWKIEEFSKKKKLMLDLYSEYFYSNEYGYRLRVMLRFNILHICVNLHFDHSFREKHLPLIFHHKRAHFILDQSDRQEKIHISKTYEPRFRNALVNDYIEGRLDRQVFCSYKLLERFNSVYLKNDQLFVKTVVDHVLDYTVDPLACHGTLTWIVSRYQKTKQESLDRICFVVGSDSFYSSEFGYRMRTGLHFTEGQLFMRLKFVVGQFDYSLPDIFAHKVTFSILDQNDRNGGNSLRREVKLDPKELGEEKAKRKMSVDDYCHSVEFPICDFEKVPFLVNDTILIEVVVEPI